MQRFPAMVGGGRGCVLVLCVAAAGWGCGDPEVAEDVLGDAATAIAARPDGDEPASQVVEADPGRWLLGSPDDILMGTVGLWQRAMPTSGLVVAQAGGRALVVTLARNVTAGDTGEVVPVSVSLVPGSADALELPARVVAQDVHRGLALLEVSAPMDLPVPPLRTQAPMAEETVAVVAPIDTRRNARYVVRLARLVSPDPPGDEAGPDGAAAEDPAAGWHAFDQVLGGVPQLLGAPVIDAAGSVVGLAVGSASGSFTPPATHILPAEQLRAFLAEHLDDVRLAAPVVVQPGESSTAVDTRLRSMVAAVQHRGGRLRPVAFVAEAGDRALAVSIDSGFPHETSRTKPGAVLDGVTARFFGPEPTSPSAEEDVYLSRMMGGIVGRDVWFLWVPRPPFEIVPGGIADPPHLFERVYLVSVPEDGMGEVVVELAVITERRTEPAGDLQVRLSAELEELRPVSRSLVLTADGGLVGHVSPHDGSRRSLSLHTFPQESRHPKPTASSISKERSASPSSDGRAICEVQAHVRLIDPLAEARRVALRFYQASETDFFPHVLERLPLLGEPVAVAELPPAEVRRAAGTLEQADVVNSDVQATIPCPDGESWLQIVIETGSESIVSFPHRISSSGRQEHIEVATGAGTWGPAKALPEDSRRGAAGPRHPSCVAPFERLPGGEIALASPSRDPTCGPQLVQTVRSGERRCADGLSWVLGTDGAGRLLRATDGRPASLVLRHVPLPAPARDGVDEPECGMTGQLEIGPIMAVDPCRGRAPEGVLAAGPDRLIFRCRDGYVRDDGKRLSVGRHRIVHTGGAEGPMLLATHWGNLGLWREGEPIVQVHGLPDGVCTRCGVLAHRVRDGFLVVLPEAGGNDAPLRLIHVHTNGRARARGRFGLTALPLNTGFLSARGAVLTIDRVPDDASRVRVLEHLPDGRPGRQVLEPAPASGVHGSVSRLIAGPDATQAPPLDQRRLSERAEASPDEGPAIAPLPPSLNLCGTTALAAPGSVVAGFSSGFVTHLDERFVPVRLPTRSSNLARLVAHDGKLIDPDLGPLSTTNVVWSPELGHCTVPGVGPHRGRWRSGWCVGGRIGRVVMRPGGSGIVVQCDGSSIRVPGTEVPGERWLEDGDGEPLAIEGWTVVAAGRDGRALLLRDHGRSDAGALALRLPGEALRVLDHDEAGRPLASLVSPEENAFFVVAAPADPAAAARGTEPSVLWRIGTDGSLVRVGAYPTNWDGHRVAFQRNVALARNGRLYVEQQGELRRAEVGGASWIPVRLGAAVSDLGSPSGITFIP